MAVPPGAQGVPASSEVVIAPRPLPTDFLGLGYEMSSPARLGLLSPANTVYLNLIRNLGNTGLLRFGGIVADYTTYAPDGPAATEPKHTVITRAALEQLRAFLDRTGWKAIWSVNFGQGTLPEAVTEARDVVRILGDRLAFLELGNEVENYGKGAHPLRKPPYSFHQFRAEYSRWHAAIAAAVPGLRFAAPDTAESVEWVETMAADSGGTVQLLTTHYYRNGQQHGSAEQLAAPDPALRLKLQRLRTVVELNGIPWRMCETNSFSGGGLPGVSDTPLGALWTLDYLLLLASYGCSGVNLETGVNQLGFVSSYSPIQDDGQGHNTAGAPYYGVLAFAQVCRPGDTIAAMPAAPGQPKFTSYRVGEAARASAYVFVNRHATRTAQGRLEGTGAGLASVLRLRGEAGAALTLGGAAVDAVGNWKAAVQEPLQSAVVEVPPMSAAVVRLEQ